MNRPSIRKFKKPTHISEYPTGPCFDAGHLVTENASWRTEKPVHQKEKCIGCYYCYLCCPEGVIFKSKGKADIDGKIGANGRINTDGKTDRDGSIGIDYAFCKGCGICSKVCKRNAIQMIREAAV